MAQAGGIGTNAIVSPYGVSDVMMMVDVGAAGRTATQIQKGMLLPGSGSAEASAYAGLACALQSDGSSDGQALDVANALWGQQGVSFQTAFVDVLSQGYGAPLQTVDFASDPTGATTAVNAWVSQATQRNITGLLGPADVTPRTRLVLVNALYFKGTWATGFDPSMTAPAAFTLPDGSTANVTTMRGTIQVSVHSDTTLLVVELPYEGGALAMDILMPEPQPGDLAGFERTLTSPSLLQALIASLGAPEWDIVHLPKFSFPTRVELGPVLQGMGITDAFMDGVADFSGMDGTRNLSLGAVVQEARIEVDEQGTVAAAGTGVTVCGGCLVVTSPPVVQIDRPFVFLIRDTRTAAILFMGQVVNPGQ
jgi:serpin B